VWKKNERFGLQKIQKDVSLLGLLVQMSKINDRVEMKGKEKAKHASFALLLSHRAQAPFVFPIERSISFDADA
jgi:hypothetical protein